MTKYFGTDGVRGLANQDLTPELAFKLGRYGGYVLQQHANLDDSETPRVIVARDPRISGEMLEAALVSGLLSIGISVMRAGVISTPAVAYLTKTQNVLAGVMISASHNPAHDNGIKFFAHDGFKLSDDQEAEIEELLNSGEDNLPRPSAEGLGRIEDFRSAANQYSRYIMSTVSADLSGMSVCVDAANGATAPIVNQVFADLETDFYTIGDRPDGLNINDGYGSTAPEKLQKTVQEKSADLGLAFDGDGDRVIAVDELGRIVDGDRIMFILSKYLKEKGRLKNDTVVSTVMSNLGFYKALDSIEVNSVQTAVGDRYVVEAMLEGGHNLGGEQSGHIIMLDYNTTGDGLLVGLQLMAVMQETGKKLSELADEVTIYPQRLINVRVKDKDAVMDVEEVQAAAHKVEEKLADNGRLLLRPSGTEPLFRVMVEAPTQEEVDEACEYVAQVVEEFCGD